MRGKIGAALHAVSDALYNHRYECCRISCVLQDFEHSVLAVLVLASKHVCHLLCASIDLSKVVVDSVVAQLLYNVLRNNTCNQEELCLISVLSRSAKACASWAVQSCNAWTACHSAKVSCASIFMRDFCIQAAMISLVYLRDRLPGNCLSDVERGIGCHVQGHQQNGSGAWCWTSKTASLSPMYNIGGLQGAAWGASTCQPALIWL